MSLIDRVKKLEQQVDNNREHVPGLVYWPQGESFAEARARYQLKHGFSLPVDAPVIEFIAVDARKEGGGRELSREEYLQQQL